MFDKRTEGRGLMEKEQFFKPTPLYKEFMILDLISKNSDITQRVMAEALDVSVSMINIYLEDYEKRRLIKREYRSPKDVQYEVTKKGLERKKVLNLGFIKSAQTIYYPARDNILAFLAQVVQKGFRNILLYGAGEVAEVFLRVIGTEGNGGPEVIAIVDDDPQKQNNLLNGLPIIRKDQIPLFHCDGILIASFSHHESIKKSLFDMNYPKEKIVEFF